MNKMGKRHRKTDRETETHTERWRQLTGRKKERETETETKSDRQKLREVERQRALSAS